RGSRCSACASTLRLYRHRLRRDRHSFPTRRSSDLVTELAYDKTPVKSMGDLIELTDLVKMNLSKITVPTLIFSSITDHVVPPENSHYIYNNINSKRKTMIELKNSYHVATL